MALVIFDQTKGSFCSIGESSFMIPEDVMVLLNVMDGECGLGGFRPEGAFCPH